MCSARMSLQRLKRRLSGFKQVPLRWFYDLCSHMARMLYCISTIMGLCYQTRERCKVRSLYVTTLMGSTSGHSLGAALRICKDNDVGHLDVQRTCGCVPARHHQQQHHPTRQHKCIRQTITHHTIVEKTIKRASERNVTEEETDSGRQLEGRRRRERERAHSLIKGLISSMS